MSTIKIRVSLSEAARCEYSARTGEILKSDPERNVDLVAFNPEQRARLFEATGAPRDYGYHDLSHVSGTYSQDTLVVLERVPETPDEWLDVASRFTAKRAEHDAQLDREQAAKAAKRQERIDEGWRYIAAARVRSLDELVQEHHDGRSPLFRGFLDGAPDDLANALKALREPVAAELARQAEEIEAAEKAAKAILAAERREWIVGHGSDYLKRAVSAGYNCQKRYVLERAALEHPSATVGWEYTGDWKSRSCPSEAGLELAEKVGGEVVWLTSPPLAEKPTDEEAFYDEPFEACEAVVVQGYLGKYDVVYYV